MIFVRTNDVLGRTVRAIIKQLYNYVGFYVGSDVHSHTRVWIVDVLSSAQPVWLETHTLEALCAHPLVQCVSIRNLRPGIDTATTTFPDHQTQLEHFKLSICNALQGHTTLDLSSAVLKLFGHTCSTCEGDGGSRAENKSSCTTDWCTHSNADLINTVLRNYGIYEGIRSSTAYTTDGVELWADASAHLYSVMAHRSFTPHVHNTVAGLGHYLADNEYFEPLHILDSVVATTDWNYINMYNLSQGQLCAELWQLLVQFASTTPEFYTHCVLQHTAAMSAQKLNYAVDKLVNLTRNLLHTGTGSARAANETEFAKITKLIDSARGNDSK